MSYCTIECTLYATDHQHHQRTEQLEPSRRTSRKDPAASRHRPRQHAGGSTPVVRPDADNLPGTRSTLESPVEPINENRPEVRSAMGEKAQLEPQDHVGRRAL